MNTEIVVALITLFGSAIGTLAGILASTKLVTYRIEQLEKKVDKHNTLIERMTEAETKITFLEDDVEKLQTHVLKEA